MHNKKAFQLNCSDAGSFSTGAASLYTLLSHKANNHLAHCICVNNGQDNVVSKAVLTYLHNDSEVKMCSGKILLK